MVEKFIGDAVMAVWGAPMAREDDAERAVRAGLDLVAAVSSYGSERARVEINARVGVVTGMAATTEIPEEGFVVGDRVNTAARIQSVAPPGCCYVDESTKRATDAAIAYVDAGSHQLKGKAETVQLYSALRVVAGVGGALKSEGLEAPFVGRDRELRLVKDLFHASAEEQRAHLVSVTGHCRDRKEPARLGVLQVHGRSVQRVPMAPGTLPILRRGRRLLGTRRDGAGPGRHPRR